MTSLDPDKHYCALIGTTTSPSGYWLYSSDNGYDLTHPPTPTSSLPATETLTLTAQPSKSHPELTQLTIDPKKSALVIIDMQNFFLSTALGRSSSSNGAKAQHKLLSHAIPAARKAGVRVVWINWGLTDEDVSAMPAAVQRAFGVRVVQDGEWEDYVQREAESTGRLDHAAGKATMLGEKNHTIYKGLGQSMGTVRVDGKDVDAGRLLMRDTWNAALTPELHAEFEKGQKSSLPDVLLHKDRMSALWDGTTMSNQYFRKEGIKTLLFAGVNTDQCVGGTVQDAFSRGYDVIMLEDGAATSSPDCAQEGIVYNVRNTWGFGLSCQQFWDGVEKKYASQ